MVDDIKFTDSSTDIGDENSDTSAKGEKAWYVVNSYSTHEKKVAENLKRRIETMGLENLIFRIIVAETEVPLPLNYKGVQMDCGYRMDMVINHKIIIELKSVNEFQPVHYKQLRTYLKLFSKNVGLLINFDVADFKNGCRRITLDNFHSWYE